MAKAVGRTAKVKVVVLPHGRDLPLPKYETHGSAGLDLVAAVAADKPMRLKRGAFAVVPTGLMFELPRGMEAQVRPRSGLAAKHAVTVLNAPGTIDGDYRGEIKVILINHGPKTFVIQRGDRIAQMILAPVTQVTLQEAQTLRASERGSGGFGSTGMKALLPKPSLKANAAKLNGKAAAAKVAAKAPAPAKRKAAGTKKTLVAFPRRPVKSQTTRRR
jgi:dUTP pyrophosphatase